MTYWQEVIFSDVVAVNPSRTLRRGTIAPYVEMAAIREFARQIETIRPREFNGSGSRFQNGDTLLARITPCLENGKTAFLHELDADEVGWGSTEFIVLSGKPGITDKLFVYYLAISEPVRAYAIQNMTGTSGRQRVSPDIFKRFTLTLPPLPIQRRIAEILGRLDDKIEVNQRINHTLEAMAGALYKHWFVDFGPFQDGAFVESALGLIPQGWKVTKLGQVVNLNPSSISKIEELKEIMYVDISSVSTGRIDDFSVMPFADAPSRARRRVAHGDTIWSGVRPGRRSFCLIMHPADNLLVSTGFIVIRPLTVPYSFAYSLAATQEFTDYLVLRESGAAYPAVKADDFAAYDICLPPQDVLNKYHILVEMWLEQSHALQLESQKLTEIRNYLLPKLLSGEIPVEAAIQQVEDVTANQPQRLPLNM